VGTARLDDYFDCLELYAEKSQELFNTLLINATGSFRDPQAWQYRAVARTYAPSAPMPRSGSIRPRPPARA
jgi:chemotaxis methyl-accepting protein methylase